MYCFAQCSKSTYEDEDEDEDQEKDTYSCMISNSKALYVMQPEGVETNSSWPFKKFSELVVRDHQDETPNYRFYLILE